MIWGRSGMRVAGLSRSLLRVAPTGMRGECPLVGEPGRKSPLDLLNTNIHGTLGRLYTTLCSTF